MNNLEHHFTPSVISLFSRIEHQPIEIKAVEATFIFAFADETVIEHSVYWCENGEIIPKDRSLTYEDIMSHIYKLEKSTWESGVIHYGVFVNDDSEVSDEPSAEPIDGVYTKKEIIERYIYSLDNPQVVPPSYTQLH